MIQNVRTTIIVDNSIKVKHKPQIRATESMQLRFKIQVDQRL